MARRRYGKPSPAISQAGQSERPRDPAGDASLAQPIEPRPEQSPQQPPSAPAPDPTPEPSPHFSSGLGEQLRQQQAYQQQHNWHSSLAHYLASIPGMSAGKHQYLMHYFTAYPDRLSQQHWNTIAGAHRIALDRGVPEDSAEYFHFVNQLLHQQHAVTPPSPAAPPPTIPCTLCPVVGQRYRNV